MNIIIILICISSVTSRRPELRIIGGRDASVGEYPFAAALEISLTSPLPTGGSQVITKHLCTGAILSRKWTLIAAHCCGLQHHYKHVIRTITYPQNHTQFRSHLARQKPANTTKTAGNTFDVESMHKHPNYHDNSAIFNFNAKNDIALVKSKDIYLESYAQISAVDHKSLIGLKATTIGYGMMKMMDMNMKSPKSEPRTLQVLDVAVTECEEFDVYNILTPKLCVSMKCDKMSATTCSGDSGAPLFVDSRVVAVTSGGIDIKCFKNINKVANRIDYSKARVVPWMTPVSPYLNWIANTLNDK